MEKGLVQKAANASQTTIGSGVDVCNKRSAGSQYFADHEWSCPRRNSCNGQVLTDPMERPVETTHAPPSSQHPGISTILDLRSLSTIKSQIPIE